MGFVSVSGVTNEMQLMAIAKTYGELGVDFPLVIGYQVSNKSIIQGTRNNRQPLFRDLGFLAEDTRKLGLIPAFHYYTKDRGTVLEDLEKIAEFGKGGLVQFNTLPLDYDTLSQVKEMGFDVIFKVAVSNKKDGGYSVWKGEGVEDVSSGDVSGLVRQVEERADVIDYVMFDPSHGTNLGLDLSEGSVAVRFGQGIREVEALKGKGLVFAGGVGPNNVYQTAINLRRYLPKDLICLDTESAVRDVERIGGMVIKDELNLDKVSSYLRSVAVGLG